MLQSQQSKASRDLWFAQSRVWPDGFDPGRRGGGQPLAERSRSVARIRADSNVLLPSLRGGDLSSICGSASCGLRRLVARMSYLSEAPLPKL